MVRVSEEVDGYIDVGVEKYYSSVLSYWIYKVASPKPIVKNMEFFFIYNPCIHGLK